MCPSNNNYYRFEKPILEILYRAKTVFMRSAITPPIKNWSDGIWNSVSQMWGAGRGAWCVGQWCGCGGSSCRRSCERHWRLGDDPHTHAVLHGRAKEATIWELHGPNIRVYFSSSTSPFPKSTAQIRFVKYCSQSGHNGCMWAHYDHQQP